MSCTPDDFKCQSSIAWDCYTAPDLSIEERKCECAWQPIYTGKNCDWLRLGNCNEFTCYPPTCHGEDLPADEPYHTENRAAETTLIVIIVRATPPRSTSLSSRRALTHPPSPLRYSSSSASLAAPSAASSAAGAPSAAASRRRTHARPMRAWRSSSPSSSRRPPRPWLSRPQPPCLWYRPPSRPLTLSRPQPPSLWPPRGHRRDAYE